MRAVRLVGVLLGVLIAAVTSVSVGAGPMRAAELAALVVSGVSPPSGVPSGGTVVAVSGSGLSDVVDVRFGGRSAASVTVVSDTKLTAVAPAGTGAVDVVAYTADSASTGAVRYTYATGARFTPLSPVRVLDTRSGLGTPQRKVGAGGSVELDLSARIPGTATAVVLNVTGTNVTGSTFVTVWPAAQPRPEVSNLNLVQGRTTPNLVTVAVTDGRIRLYNNSGSVDLIADLAGYYSVDSSDSFSAMPPTRVLDTRAGIGAPRAAVGPGGSVELDLSARIPGTATAVVLNVTGTNVTGSTFVTVWPAAQPRPEVSNLNLTAGQTTPNLVTVAVSSGRVRLFNNSGAVDLIADLAGFYDPGAGAAFVPLPPQRMLDTRSGTGVPAGPVSSAGVVPLDLSTVVAPNATAAVLNITATNVTSSTYVTAFPHGTPRPGASNLNPAAGQTVPNLAVVAAGTGTVVDLYNFAGSLDLVADLAGYFVPDLSAGSTDVEPLPTTATPAATAVQAVTGDPSTEQTTVLSDGADVPEVGGHLAVPETAAAPDGVLGTVTAVDTREDGSTAVTTTPASLDEAYSTFQIAVDADLSEEDVSVVQPGARAAATPFKLNLSAVNFSCSGSGAGPTISLTADLSRIHLQFNLDIWQPAIHFLLDVRPVFDLNIGFTGQITCTIAGGGLLKARIPISAAPPLDLTLQPVFTLTAAGQVGVNFRWEPSMVLGFDRSPRVNQDIRSFGSTGGVGVTGNASFEAFTGLSAAVSLGGRAGVSGDFGPVLTGQIDTRGCRTVDIALRAQLSAFADLFVRRWTFALASGTFARTRIYDSCKPGLRSWGANYDGQLGTGLTGGSSSAPVPVSLPDGVTATTGTMALRADGTVWTWGANTQGQLGRNPVGPDSPTPQRVFGILGVTSIASNTFTNYAIRSDRTVWGWGADSQGELGRGRAGTRSVTPIRIPGLTDVVAVVSDSFSAFALRADGTVWGWGWLPNGLSGANCGFPAACIFPPTRVNGLANITGMAAGSLTTFALRSDGTVWAWGANLDGALGNGSTVDGTATPVRVSGLTDIRQITAGHQTGFALRGDGTVWAWGNNEGGALGNGTWCDNCFSRTPVQVRGATSVAAITAGGTGTLGWNASTYTFGLALRTDGTVLAWGDNNYGQLGLGTSCGYDTHCPQTTATRITSLSRITAIAATESNGYALILG
jgi:alpha-tubulin suppressor-like RCC1 family protein